MSAVSFTRHADDEGAWDRWIARPAPALRGLVTRYQGFTEIHAAFPAQRELPSTTITLVISLSGRFFVSDPRDPSGARSHADMVTGLWSTYGLSRLEPGWSGIQVDFTPMGARAFLGVPMHELSERAEDLSSVAGRRGSDLAERLGNLDRWDDRFAMLDRLFSARLTRAPSAPPVVRGALARLRACNGGISVAELAEQLGCGRTYLWSAFRDHVGGSPKLVGRILRFTHARTLLERPDSGRISEIAQACGYYDQAHLVRDFRKLAGYSPTELRARALAGAAVADTP